MKDRQEKVQTFVNTQLFHGPKCRWSKAQRDLALKQYFISPVFYRHLIQDGFVTPSISTIHHWHSIVKFGPGISNEMDILLTARAAGMSNLNKKCVLNFDEMSSKSELEYSEKVQFLFDSIFYTT